MTEGSLLLMPVQEWVDAWCGSIVDALYARERKLAEVKLEEARGALERDTELSPDHKSAAELRLHYFEYQIHKALGERREWRHHFEEALGRIGWPVYTPAAQVQQRILLCLLRASGMRLNYCDFAPKQFHHLFDDIPDDARGPELWHSAATWAFYQRDEKVLGDALGYFTVESDGYMADYFWQHINAMYQLVTGKAAERDVVELLKRIQLTPQLEDFNRHIWPRVLEEGLATDAVHILKEEVTEKVEREGAFVPRREVATKGVVRRI